MIVNKDTLESLIYPYLLVIPKTTKIQIPYGSGGGQI